ncbi:MAG: KpsF/GutQ family sugar-phosphate isomerase, partial [bacterium]|nr:KpsF/GutQ family sugar-phosphate isomerase [bacterium]
MNAKKLITLGKKTVKAEALALTEMAGRMGPEFPQAVELLLAAKGKVIITGVGKSGLIGQKIAATLTSTGTPAFFLHPT